MAHTRVPIYGQLTAFDPEAENISTYLERVSLYFAANDIGDGKKVSVLLTEIGTKNYGIIRSLVAPALPQDKTFADLVTVLTDHFQPKPLIIAERFRFYQRNQGPTESVLDYVAELRRLAITCDFGTFLDQALRDKFVCGLKSEQTQKSLLAEEGLTLAKAVEKAQAKETAARDARNLKGQGPTTMSGVLQLSTTNTMKGSAQVKGKPCFRCGRKGHEGKDCKFKSATCHKCGKVGHIAPTCRSKKSAGRGHNDVRYLESTQSEPEDLGTFLIGGNSSHPIRIELRISGKPLTMELDTGAAVSLLPEGVFRKMFPKAKLRKSNMVLRTYTGEAMAVIGTYPVLVQYEQQLPWELDLTIVRGEGPALLGRNWLKHITLNWASIGSLSREQALQDVLDKNKDVFADDLGTIQPFTAKLSVSSGARPKFCRARPVPYAMRSAVEEELDRLEAQGVIEKIDHSEWAAPIVAVPKKDGQVRICGDYKVTVNPVLEVDQYPLPKPEDLFATLAGGQQFTTLDLSHAYNQLVLEEQSRHLVTINTHRGLYRYRRLPFGIASAPAVFQKTMDTLLQGLGKVTCYLDDILITGATPAEHLAHLEEVLCRLREHGVRLRRDKCRFLEASVEYLGHRVDREGLHATNDKLRAIAEAPPPRNVQELRSFLGLLNYYGRFIPNLASLLHPLHKLLCKGCPWKWSSGCQKAFNQAKEALTSSKVLIHYNPNLPLKLAGDASAYGVGAVISHVMEDGSERPIAFASRTLSSSERNYAQVEKEALSLVFGVKKFHAYLYGRQFTLTTDHKPLTTILGPKQGIPTLAAARLQRWALILSAYTYHIEFRPTGQHANADGLSRLPLQEVTREGASSEPSVFNISQLESLPVTVKQLQAATRTDNILSKVLRFTRGGWPKKFDASLRPYWLHRQEFTVEQDCVLWGVRTVIPGKLQQKLLEELHRDHPGISRMKAVARGYLWWPGLDKSIQDLVKSCQSCQAVKHAPAVAPMYPWSWPAKPWQRVHLDFAGPFQGVMLLVAVDAHSKWPEVEIMHSTTAAKTIDVLRKMFATFGLPEQLVTDNGPQFLSEEFALFSKLNGIRHIRSAPYHPATNGLAERFVQSVKLALKASVNSGKSLSERLLSYLLTYRSSPHATTGVSPCSLFLHRPLRTRLDLLRPNLEACVVEKQAQQKAVHDRRAQCREFLVGQSVMVRNFRPGQDWVPAIVVERLGPVSYLVETADHQMWRRHLDHLKEFRGLPNSVQSGSDREVAVDDEDPLPTSSEPTTGDFPDEPHAEDPPPEVDVPVSDPPPTPSGSHAEPPDPGTRPSSSTAIELENPEPPPPRYPTRIRHPPERYQ